MVINQSVERDMREPTNMHVYMDSDLFDRIHKEAKKDGRKASPMVCRLVNEALEARVREGSIVPGIDSLPADDQYPTSNPYTQFLRNHLKVIEDMEKREEEL